MMSIGVSGPLVAWIGPDSKNTKEYIVNFYQYGLGLPDRDFYLADNPQFDGLRAAYLTYLTNVGGALGFETPAAAAQAIYDLEKSMASIQWTRVESRNRDKTYNKFSPEDFLAKAGDFPGSNSHKEPDSLQSLQSSFISRPISNPLQRFFGQPISQFGKTTSTSKRLTPSLRDSAISMSICTLIFMARC